MKIVTVVGARPQFVKAATVSRAIVDYNRINGNRINEILLHTGQHYDPLMSDIFFKEMGIPQPAYNLCIAGGSHGEMTGNMLAGIEKFLLEENPDVVLVYGDTNSTLAGALAAAKLHISIAHVESGLRSWNMRMPEEINRVLTDRISNLLLCPTQVAVDNLMAEGLTADKRVNREVLFCGDVMFDAVQYYRKQLKTCLKVKEHCRKNAKFILATIHRAENTENKDRLEKLVAGLELLAQEIPVVLPIHPGTYAKLNRLGIKFQKVEVWEPLGYFDMLAMLEHCSIVATDSGGLQKEAYYFQKPCLTLRTETEWVELVQNGWNWLCGAEPEEILMAYRGIQDTTPEWKPDLYGDGNAGAKIVCALVQAADAR